jgi:hypothetical protein
MSHRDKTQYPKNHPFTVDELLEVTPTDLFKWMAFKVYGIENPGPNDNPTFGRSSSLSYYKKAISYFMPHRLIQWNFQQELGNPTKSTEVNDLIKAVIRKETRREGKPSQARRPFEKEEFLQVLRLCSEFRDPNIKYGIPCLIKFAFHLIARLDDSCEFKMKNFKVNFRYPDTLIGRLRWSKNVRDERDAPDQILMGAMDPYFCVLLALGLHLETTFLEVSDQSELLFHFGKSTPQLANKFVSDSLRLKVLRDEDFISMVEDGELGTHSVRKYSSTHARRTGCSKDHVDFRGRWKRDTRQQDDYTDVDLPYPDGKVAAALCVGGACKYVLKSGGRVTSEWIRRHIVPNISNHFPPQIAVVLGTAILWSAFNPETAQNVPQNIRRRISTAYTDYVRGSLELDENPVEKLQLVTSEIEGVLYLDELSGGAENEEREPSRMDRNTGMAILANQQEMKRGLSHLQSQVDVISVNQTRYHETVNKNVNRLARQPGRRFRNQGRHQNQQPTPDDVPADDYDDGIHAAGQAMELNARLSNSPRTLYLLWEEYTVGVGGMKAARLFTAAERGRSKHSYSRRKAVWDKIAELIRAGYTSETAIDKIYKAYGESLPVSTIISAIIRDRKNGGHPQLRI